MIDVATVSAFSRRVHSLGLKGGLNAQEIVKIIRTPMPLLSSKHGRINELDYAMEMAGKVEAQLPLFHFSGEMNAESVYDAYYALRKQYLPEK